MYLSVKLEVIAKCGGLAYVVVQLQLQGATPRGASPRAAILPLYTDARGDVVLKIRSANLAAAIIVVVYHLSPYIISGRPHIVPAYLLFTRLSPLHRASFLRYTTSQPGQPRPGTLVVQILNMIFPFIRAHLKVAFERSVGPLFNRSVLRTSRPPLSVSARLQRDKYGTARMQNVRFYRGPFRYR